MPSGLLRRRRGTGLVLSMDIKRIEKPPNLLSLLEDKYNIQEKVGCGSAGMVHRAVCLESGREVALKMPLSTDPGPLDAAKREYELLKRLEPHPNIVRAYDFHNLQGEATLVLEFFAGSTLQDVVKEGRLPESTARGLATSLCGAVAHLHAHNVYHRDIKPQNILVSQCQSDLRLIDFNVAVCVDNGAPLTPTGTELYKAPELLRGEAFCDRSDVWATGLCMFFMLSGSLPQVRDTIVELCRKEEVASRAVSFTARCWRQVSSECKAMLRWCLAIEPQDRPAMSELLDDDWFVNPLMRLLSSVVPAQPASDYLNALTYVSPLESYINMFSSLSKDAIIGSTWTWSDIKRTEVEQDGGEETWSWSDL